MGLLTLRTSISNMVVVAVYRVPSELWRVEANLTHTPMSKRRASLSHPRARRITKSELKLRDPAFSLLQVTRVSSTMDPCTSSRGTMGTTGAGCSVRPELSGALAM